ncbi:adenylyl-sulfate kinase [Accumulibacter sp.]|jgi:adenylylsulfate kinase|uniref:adenylyl-sulfate kinase n=1 Tax=Accumulibacter sp. TaxID=2053492 RepID=UPI001AC488CE|nr:adenylyl-sulfate kinase [Accumulibacter sp.]MBN8452303.1 adenylyl-sulfate kinase [Accumulibacter sp.]
MAAEPSLPLLPHEVVWHDGQVSRAEREKLLGQRALTVWLTGLSAAGKSTLAFALERELHERGRACYVLDGDNVRHGLNSNLGFSPPDRRENIRRIAEVARLMNDAGLMVITAFISPWRADRAAARAIIGAESFLEVHVGTPLAVCEARDPKGMYARARRGELAEFTGVSSPYEVPLAADLTLDMGQLSLPEALAQLVGRIGRHAAGQE